MSDKVILRGLILQETEVGDGNKIVTVFAKDHGKVSVKANGAKKATSKFLAGTQQLHYCDYVVTNKNNFYFLNSADVIKSFYKITEDYETLCCALACIEITNKNVQENCEANEELFLLIHTLNAFCDTENPKLVLAIFIMKLMQIFGLEPFLDGCCICEEDVIKHYFGFEGLVCDACKEGEEVIKTNKNIITKLRSVFLLDTKEVFKDNTDELTSNEISHFYKLAAFYLKQHTEINYLTLNSIN